MPDFLPRRDAELLQWSDNFNRHVVASPASYGLTPEQAAAYQALHEAFAERLQRATAPATRTGPAVLAKDAARAALVERARVLAGVARGDPAVGDEARLRIGLRPRNPLRPRIMAPALAPRIGVVSVVGQTVRLRLRDAGSARPYAKPRGVTGITIFTWIGETPPTHRKAWRFATQASRTTVDVRFDEPVPPGAKVWLTAEWFTCRGERSPTSDPVSTHLLGGVIVAGGRLAA